MHLCHPDKLRTQHNGDRYDLTAPFISAFGVSKKQNFSERVSDTLTGCREIEPDFAFDGRSRISILRVLQRQKARMPHGCAAFFFADQGNNAVSKMFLLESDMLFNKSFSRVPPTLSTV